jgi:hypothetical protein
MLSTLKWTYSGYARGAGDRRATASSADLGTTVAVEDAERFELAVQRRARHPDKGRGAGNIAAETGHLGKQVFTLEDLARVAQRQAHDLETEVFRLRHRRFGDHYRGSGGETVVPRAAISHSEKRAAKRRRVLPDAMMDKVAVVALFRSSEFP